MASSHFVSARVGFGAASDLMLSGRMLDAPAAHEVGLCDELVGPDRLVDAAVSESDLSLVQRREMALLHEAYASPEHAAAV